MKSGQGKLGLKLIASFILITLLGTFTTALIIRLTTDNYYQKFVFQGHVNQAFRLGSLLAGYYTEKGSWQGVEDYIRSLAVENESMMQTRRGQLESMSPQPPDIARLENSRRGNRRGMQPMMQHGMMMSNMLPGCQRIVLTKPDGAVIIDSEDRLKPGTMLRADQLQKSLPVNTQAGIAGRILVGSMIEPMLGPQESEFLTSVNHSIWLASGLLFIIAVLAGVLLVMHIIRPLRALALGVKHIASGDFSIRVKVKTRDELGDLAENFNTMVASLEAAEAWKKQIIADAAHELRTPVSLIQGQLEMMLEGVYELDRKNLQSLYEEARRLAALISELQELAFAESGKLVLQLTDVDLGQLAREALVAFRAEADRKEINFRYDQKGELPLVAIDKQKIYQVISNLLSNALRYTPQGGEIAVSLDLATGKETGTGLLPELAPPVWQAANNVNFTFVRLTVADTGPGIPSVELERIFERFYRLDRARNRQEGGSGLGLAICREIIHLHGGRIWAEDTGVNGARFCFTLPVRK